jgi:hypothetical protein
MINKKIITKPSEVGRSYLDDLPLTFVRIHFGSSPKLDVVRNANNVSEIKISKSV